jgi:hypothetical protein
VVIASKIEWVEVAALFSTERSVVEQRFLFPGTRTHSLTPEAIFYQRIREFRGWKKRTSAAKAGNGSVICGTAEAVPFQDRVLTPTLKAVPFKETLRTVPCRYRAPVSSDIEGGASPGVLPQLRFGLLSISRISVPPLAISEWENHGLLSDLPLSRAD